MSAVSENEGGIPQQMTKDTTEGRILSWLESQYEKILGDVMDLVRSQSPSTDKVLADQCGREICRLMERRLGLAPTVYPQQQYGDHLSFSWGETGPQILMLAHFDTVWNRDQLPLRQEGDVLRGPGVFDMKSGLVSAVWAVNACEKLALPLNKRICFFFNSDEEVSSPSSRTIVEKLARESSAALCMEPAESKTGNLKVARKGVLKYVITLKGRAAHAGNDIHLGVSAVEEAARQILYLHSLTDYQKGTTLNVGVVKGGTRPNIVAEQAVLELDVRVETPREGERIDRIIRQLKPSRPDILLEVKPAGGRPPMEACDAALTLLDRAKESAKALGFTVGGVLAGGGSDGNFTAAVGCPTLDGLGPVGEGAHALTEQIDLKQFLPRIAMAAGLLLRL